ncbi:MAG TPA: 2-oxo-4-hydroxy-4-carboxy-5-ureidoimidazoline decarboxylase [Hyphomicrobiaceae bacterium]|nr:2-oxo-4-hydroxy-4-carboxy-5-ureidoimidazoline decarboxylase [Hyphomicrobiaceae bacterium]
MAQACELAELNAVDRDRFVAALEGVFENAPWVAERAWSERPFGTVADLHHALMAALTGASEAEQILFIRGHPELGGTAARAGVMTHASRLEQGGLGLDRLSEAEFQRFERLNGDYRERFGMPFIICVGRHTRPSILSEFARRIANGREAERAAALDEVGYITRLRLNEIVEGPGKPPTDGRLSTHVLDLVSGRPAMGVRVVLKELAFGTEGVLKEAVTNADGRTDAPLLAGRPLRIGSYEIAFHIGAYFAERGVARSRPPFLDVVPIRFAIAEPEANYHVPLLASPWAYSTYRGS